MKTVIRGRRTTKKAIRAFNLKRMKSRNEFKKMNKKLIRESKKLIKKISIEVKKILDEKTKEYCKKTISVVEKIIDQQAEMIGEKKRYVKDRIVSFHEAEIRPIFRSKDRNKVEFGPKLRVSVIAGGLIQTSKLANNNFSDTEMVEASIDVHKKTFKRVPNELITDRGGHSPKNHKLLEDEGIKDGVQYRGRIPAKANLPPPTGRKRMAKQRVVVEGKIGTFKTKYKGARNEYRHANAQAWISFGFMAMNAKWATSR